MKGTSSLLAITAVAAFAPNPAKATVITFDDAIAGATSFDFDADNDSLVDVTFSTTDLDGFNTVGPGVNQQFIDEPGLEGTTTLATDLRVDFLAGVEGSIQFGFALSSGTEVTDGVIFTLFDDMDNLLATASQNAEFNGSDFPEGLLNVTFQGVAAYGLFDFNDSFALRYILDDFEGEFGTTDRIVPPPPGPPTPPPPGPPTPPPPTPPAPSPISEPGTLALLGAGLTGLVLTRRRRRS